LGAGYQNTLDIVAQAGNVAATCAAAYCADLVSGGQSDWYLPSAGEMKMIYDVVRLQLDVAGFGDDYTYWTSSEDVLYGGVAWAQSFYAGNQLANGKEDATFSVRPMRRF